MKKPNIILFITHDQGQFLGCYDEQVPNNLNTPNIDNLAKNGVKFVNHFCTAPQCTPSRGSLQTSLYPHQNGLMGLVNRGWTLPKINKTIPMYLRENGYTTHLIGFQHESKNEETLGYDTVSKRVPEYQYSCKYLVDEYIKFLIDHKDDEKPYFLCIGTPEVHRPYIMWGNPVEIDSVKVPPYLKDCYKVRRDLAEFYGAIQATDKIVGQIIKCLEKTKQKAETLFIYTTDHGEAFPRAKCTLYDPGIKTLLVMHHPNSELFNSGKTINSFTINLDILPSLIDLVGAKQPENIEGKSFIPLLKGEVISIHDEIYIEKSFHEIYDPIRAIRDEDFKFIKNFEKRDTLYYMPKDIMRGFSGEVMKKIYKKPRPSEELYDLNKDPNEFINLINDPEYSHIANKLREKLNKWMKRTNDPLLNGKIKPQPSVIQNFHRIELFESIYLPIEDSISQLMRNKIFNKIISKTLKYLP
ncbi:MAG: sulfatase-like hydrolase/transferase [Candidatus Lokiarchaeota archaeon]|nr:sulfatase-like hydrolase/transferase [Candidatus Lokiarchaeota archaeon]